MALLLVDSESVRTRIGLPVRDLITTAIEDALMGTTESLQAELRTQFDRQVAAIDTFFVEDSGLRGQRFSEKFVLSNGYVTESSNDVQVEVAATKLDLIQNLGLDLRDTTNGTVTHKDQFVDVSADRGIVVVSDYRLISQYVRITYDYGFDADGTTPTLYDQSQVPATLKELATLWTMLELTANPVTGIDPNRRLEGDQQRPQHLNQRIQTLLDKLTRYEPEANDPIA